MHLPFNSDARTNFSNQDSHIPVQVQQNHNQRSQETAIPSYNNPPNTSPHISNNRRDVFDPFSQNTQNELQYNAAQQFYVPNQFSERNIPKWSIKFDGTSKPHDIQEFIFRLESMANRERYPLYDLVNIVHRF